MRAPGNDVRRALTGAFSTVVLWRRREAWQRRGFAGVSQCRSKRTERILLTPPCARRGRGFGILHVKTMMHAWTRRPRECGVVLRAGNVPATAKRKRMSRLERWEAGGTGRPAAAGCPVPGSWVGKEATLWIVQVPADPRRVWKPPWEPRPEAELPLSLSSSLLKEQGRPSLVR